MPFTPTLVKKHNGVPTIVADGVPCHGMTATSCAFNNPEVIRDFVASGVEIMMIWIEIGIHCWKAPGQYDWSYAEKKLALFEAHSGGTKWVIRVRLGLLARWWAEAHPTEVHNPPGKNPDRVETLAVCNITSSVWRGEVCQLLRDFTRWIEGTRWAGRVIGFMLNAGATEEWLIFDTNETFQGRYHPVYTREFREWLRRTYKGDAKALRRAWNFNAAGIDPKTRSVHSRAGEIDDSSLTFETAECPKGYFRNGSHIWGPYSLRDPQRERSAIDYYCFLNETLADTLVAFCRTVKETASVPVICGGFHSYLWWETGGYSYIQEYGHGLVQRLNQSPWVDFISDITSYDCRYPGGPSGYLGLPHCQNLNNTLHYTEVDLTTVSSMPEYWRKKWKNAGAAEKANIARCESEPVIPNYLWNWRLGKCGRDEDEQLAIFQREHAHNLITGTAYWWFDIKCDNYREPWMIEGIRKLSEIGRDAVQRDRASISEVAFICSEDTPMRQAAMSGSLLRFEMESVHHLLLDKCTRDWGLAGVPYDTYEINDLAHPGFPGGQYKLLIFVNCAYVSKKAAKGVKRWQKDGRTFLWTHAANVYHNERLDPAAGAELTGMRLGWRNRCENIYIERKTEKHPLTHGKALDVNFGTDGAIGPVFFADDPKAKVYGTLHRTGEPAFTVREHKGWRSMYLAMHNFGPALFRNIARDAGAHVWCGSDDVLYANRSMLCLHTAQDKPRTITLPAPAIVTDLWTGETTPRPVTRIRSADPRYRTRIWRTEYV